MFMREKKTAALTIKNKPGTLKKQLQKRSDIKKETTRKEWPGGATNPARKVSVLLRISPYSVSMREKRTRKTPNTCTFHALNPYH